MKYIHKHRVIIFFFLATAIATMAACTYKNADDVYPVNNTGSCDTSHVSYKNTIQPLLDTNCYSCHMQSTSGLGGGYVLDNYNDVSVQAQRGFLYGNVAQPDINNPSHMPRGLPSLSDCDINQIKAWVDQGYKNN